MLNIKRLRHLLKIFLLAISYIIVNVILLFFLCLALVWIAGFLNLPKASMMIEISEATEKITFLTFLKTYLFSWLMTVIFAYSLFISDRALSRFKLQRTPFIQRQWSDHQVWIFANSTLLLPSLMTLMLLFESKALTLLIFPISFFVMGQSFLYLFEEPKHGAQQQRGKDATTAQKSKHPTKRRNSMYTRRQHRGY